MLKNPKAVPGKLEDLSKQQLLDKVNDGSITGAQYYDTLKKQTAVLPEPKPEVATHKNLKAASKLFDSGAITAEEYKNYLNSLVKMKK